MSNVKQITNETITQIDFVIKTEFGVITATTNHDKAIAYYRPMLKRVIEQKLTKMYYIVDTRNDKVLLAFPDPNNERVVEKSVHVLGTNVTTKTVRS